LGEKLIMEKTCVLAKVVFKKMEGKSYTHLGKAALPIVVGPDVVALGNIFDRGKRRLLK